MHAQAVTLEKLNKGDITGFVEEVPPFTVSTCLQHPCFVQSASLPMDSLFLLCCDSV